ncbi:MAG: hypothetical protein ACLUOI_25195 [Eisenbergiella sp.]
MLTLDAIKEYFERLYHYKGEGLDAKDIIGQMSMVQIIFLSLCQGCCPVQANRKRYEDDSYFQGI